MTFAHPYFLLAVAAAAVVRVAERQARLAAGIFVFVGEIGGRPDAAAAFARGKFSGGVALAGPRGCLSSRWRSRALTKSTTEVKASGIDIVVALDLSGSMNTQDYVVNGQRVSRFNMAKAVLKKFVKERPDDRIGLVVFAAQAFIATR